MDTLSLTLGLTDSSGDVPEGRNDKKGDQKKVIAGVELSEDQIDEIKEAFLEFDMDSDGTITTSVGCMRIIELNRFSLIRSLVL